MILSMIIIAHPETNCNCVQNVTVFPEIQRCAQISRSEPGRVNDFSEIIVKLKPFPQKRRLYKLTVGSAAFVNRKNRLNAQIGVRDFVRFNRLHSMSDIWRNLSVPFLRKICYTVCNTASQGQPRRMSRTVQPVSPDAVPPYPEIFVKPLALFRKSCYTVSSDFCNNFIAKEQYYARASC